MIFILSSLLIFVCFLQRPPIVGILTRHDFMEEHVLGLFPHLKPYKMAKGRELYLLVVSYLCFNWLTHTTILIILLNHRYCWHELERIIEVFYSIICAEFMQV